MAFGSIFGRRLSDYSDERPMRAPGMQDRRAPEILGVPMSSLGVRQDAVSRLTGTADKPNSNVVSAILGGGLNGVVGDLFNTIGLPQFASALKRRFL